MFDKSLPFEIYWKQKKLTIRNHFIGIQVQRSVEDCEILCQQEIITHEFQCHFAQTKLRSCMKGNFIWLIPSCLVKKINLKNVCICISIYIHTCIYIYTHKLREIPMANTFPGSMILKFMQIKVRENTFKPKSN